MKKFSINCDFGGQMAPFDFYIGTPEKEHHPLHFQADWLSKQRQGVVPAEVMNAIAKLKDIAEKNNVSLEDLCVYAIGSWDQGQDANIETGISTEDNGSSNAEEPQDTNDDPQTVNDIQIEEEVTQDNNNLEEKILGAEIASESTQDLGEYNNVAEAITTKAPKTKKSVIKKSIKSVKKKKEE